MKKVYFFVFIVLSMMGSVFGQLGQRPVIYGHVRYDGYDQITKGAFWKVRPEAKAIYQGAHPEGYDVILLEADFFVRFIDSEHNNNDKNYIVFPKGEIVYFDKKTGKSYSAKCGNEIEFYGQVGLVDVKEQKEEAVSVSKKQIETESTGNHNVTDLGEKKSPTPEVNKSVVALSKGRTPFFKQTGVKIGCVVIGIGAIVESLLLLNKNHHGEPGGAPTTVVVVVTPPVVIPPVTPDTGGPGGAPITR